MLYKTVFVLVAGIVITLTYDDLSFQKNATQSTEVWPYDLYKAGNAVDRDITTCMRTEPIGPTSPDKTVWWKVDLGGMYNIYSVNILFKNYDGHGCLRPDVYGSDCNESCPANCRYNTCHIQNGTCFSCKPGWTGRTCNTGCSDGLYGPDCKQHCSEHCRDNSVCDHETGRCGMGCAAGWSGSLCNKVCEDGTYGYDCNNNCSGNCLGDSPCNKQTGHCKGGCSPGYTTALCNKRCVQSFGEGCRYPCSKHCLNKTCNEINGNCVYGCEMGFYGDKCEQDICSNLKTEHNISSSVWIYFGPICLGINILVMVILILCLWGVYSKKLLVSIKTRSCLKSEHYAEAVATPEDNSHYQELGVSGGRNPYLNTTIN